MFELHDLQNALVFFAVAFVVFLPLEKLFAKHKQKVFRTEYGQDLAFFSGQYLLWNGLVVSVLTALHSYLDALTPGGMRDTIQAWPFWLQFLTAILLGDFCIYWGHRLSHKFNFLWRFHRVHHTAEKLDWIAAYREHPLDNLYTRVIENTPILLLGFPLETIAGFIAFRGLWGLYIHSNVKLSPGPLKYFIGSPELHHWHHEIEHSGKANFANVMPLMDLLFGTFHDPRGEEPESYGIPEKIPHNYLVQMIAPFLPDRLTARLAGRPE